MLLDDYLPEFDVRTRYATRIAASPARAYASLWTANFNLSFAKISSACDFNRIRRCVPQANCDSNRG